LKNAAFLPGSSIFVFLFPVNNSIGLGNLAVFGKKLPFVGGGNN